MVEMLGVLAIIGVLSVAGIAGYSKAMAKFKLSKVTDQVSMTVANIRTLFSGQRSYSGLNKANAISFGVIANEMIVGANVTNAFGGEVDFGTAAFNQVPDLAFTITFKGLPKDACVSLMSADWGSGGGSGLVSIAGGTGDAQSGSDLPVTLPKAVEGCNCASDDCSITWTYL